ncbi:hypothetical protein E4U43_007333 [Claviceps pusilla]|uniref:U1-type domain-containing protein n=1 Tax=Claviceps pusilla TaxID=123648 RepID=A0A9P7NF20_9HYPO|nr:hypothetical protein E4U43_007333 [Claviceps pusilla]
MTEYWKNSPNYWCKHCGVFVRDTKLERQNHEATARHQNAIKRSLRDLHRTHDREQREKERARREIERLDGVVGGKLGDEKASLSGTLGSGSGWRSTTSQGGGAESALKQQREQLAQMGVSIPSVFLGDMAMPGEWTVTKERVIDEEGGTMTTTEGLARGVRKRGGEDTEKKQEEEEQDAVRGLFKRPRRWGREKRILEGGGGEEDAELEALLRGGVKLKGEQQHGDEMGDVKDEDENKDRHDSLAVEMNAERDETVKAEEAEEKVEHALTGTEGNEEPGITEVKKESGDEVSGIAPVVFKKRKPKGLRTR